MTRTIAAKQPLRSVAIESLTANEVGAAEALVEEAVELGVPAVVLKLLWFEILAVRPVALVHPEPTEELEPATKLTVAH